MRWTRQRFARDGIAGRVGERPVSDHQASGREMLQRTAKSCGPDAPTLASSLRSQVGPTGLRQNISAGDGGKTARSPGRARRKPLKPLRAGTSGDSGVLVYSCAFYHYQVHTRPRVQRASGVPHALFGREIYQRLGRIARRGRKRVSATNDCCLKIESMVIIAATDEATQTPSFRGDAKHRTRNLEIPGLVLRTIPE